MPDPSPETDVPTSTSQVCDRGPEPEADPDAEAPTSDSLGDLAYRRLAQVAVSEATGRTVTGFIAKRVKEGEPATNAFILEPVRTRH
jgi:hypothetical protein